MMTIPDWIRTVLISVTTGVAAAVANYFLGIRRDDRKRAQELEDKQRARFVALLQPLTATLALARRALYELQTGDESGTVDPSSVLRDAAVKLDHARSMGLPEEVEKPLDAACRSVYPQEEQNPEFGGQEKNVQAAITAVAKYLRES
jgi:hypothetical protein